MGYFILAAILSTAFFAIVLFVEPIGERVLRRLGERLENKIGVTILRILFGLLAVAAPFLFLWLIAARFHASVPLVGSISTVVFSAPSRSALLGFVFGAVFLVWIARLYSISDVGKPKRAPADGKGAAGDAKQGLPRVLVVEGYFLLLLFFAGSLDVFNPILERISGLKLFGAEVSLSDAKATSTQNAQPLSVRPVGGAPGRASTGIGAALNFLSSLDVIVARDQILGPLANPNASPAPSGIYDLAHRAIAPLAQCHAAIQSVSRSDLFMKQAFAGLDGPVHALARGVAYDVGETERAALIDELAGAYAEAASLTVARVYTNNISMYLSKPKPTSGGNDAIALPDNAKMLQDYCAPLLKLACDGSGVQTYCASAIVAREEADTKTIKNGFKNRLVDFIGSALKGDTDAARRPYLAIVAASVSSILDQPEAAAAELDRWISDRQRALAKDQVKDWNLLRAQSTLAGFTEDWLRSSRRASENSVLQDYHLSLLAQLIEDFGAILDKPFLAFRRQSNGEPTLDFDLAPIDSAHCAGDPVPKNSLDPRRVEANAAYSILTYMQNYVDRALDQGDLAANQHEDKIENYLKQLNVVDLGCLELKDPDPDDRRPEIANFRADILRLNARALLAGLSSSQNLRSADDVKATLQRALGAVTAGKALLRKARKEDLREQGDATKPVADRIAPTNVLETYDELDALEKSISARLGN